MKLDIVTDDESMKDRPWYADGLQFTCSQCGNCCTGGPGFVWISKEEIGRMAAHLQLTTEELIDQHCRKIGARYSLNENRNSRKEFDCTFLKEIAVESATGDAEAKSTRRVCTVYPVRPLQCRTWPFWKSNLEDQEAWDEAAVRCHGMNTGRKFELAQITALATAKDWPQNGPTSNPANTVATGAVATAPVDGEEKKTPRKSK